MFRKNGRVLFIGQQQLSVKRSPGILTFPNFIAEIVHQNVALSDFSIKFAHTFIRSLKVEFDLSTCQYLESQDDNSERVDKMTQVFQLRRTSFIEDDMPENVVHGKCKKTPNHHQTAPWPLFPLLPWHLLPLVDRHYSLNTHFPGKNILAAPISHACSAYHFHF